VKLGKTATETLQLLRDAYGDESWCFQYDPQTKRQSAEQRSTGTPPSKKVRRQPSTTKTMIIFFFFFDTRGIVLHEFVPQGQTVNQEVYISVLRGMRNALRRHRPDLWASGHWALLHDNARTHTALNVSIFLTKHKVTVLPHSPYSPYLSPCDFFLFPRLKKGYSSGCDDGAHRHSERGIHQQLSGLAETLATVY
jgi:histone-lysine N-methyltransferase SETMAR